MNTQKKLTIDQECQRLQAETFNYFLTEVNPANGLILDKSSPNWPSSIAATGLGLACYPVAVERGLMSHQDAVERTLTTLRFFWNSHQGPEPDATGYKGFYYHFLDIQTGKRAWDCELSTIDTTFLIAGMLTAACYFVGNHPDEQEIRLLADALYCRVDWQWAQNHEDMISLGWTPESGFVPFLWAGYDEALLLYILGLGSPTYPIAPNSFKGWSLSYEWKTIYGYEYVYAGPLFTHQLSHIWVDFRGIQDAIMRAKNMDYFENSKRATYVQHEYAKKNPLDFAGYSACCWGITASDGPGPAKLKLKGIEREFFDYVSRGAPYGPDDGTISPWCAITSLPFAPEIVLPLIEHCTYKLELRKYSRYGFTSSFNQTFRTKAHALGWISPWHFGINQGPIILMLENYRSGFVWELMKNCPYIVAGLQRARFTGGWLPMGSHLHFPHAVTNFAFQPIK